MNDTVCNWRVLILNSVYCRFVNASGQFRKASIVEHLPRNQIIKLIKRQEKLNTCVYIEIEKIRRDSFIYVETE